MQHKSRMDIYTNKLVKVGEKYCWGFYFRSKKYKDNKLAKFAKSARRLLGT